VAFWTWLWGPVGLLLATPLTVCLVVVAKHVEDLKFLVVLMAYDVPMDPGLRSYQRLLAPDEDEAARDRGRRSFSPRRPETARQG